jgi:hypothetical protein
LPYLVTAAARRTFDGFRPTDWYMTDSTRYDLKLSHLRWEGGFLMSAFKRKERRAMIATVLLSVMIMGGCAPTFKYSYDTKARFADQKSYSWAPSTSLDRLVETNVQVLADQLLAKKGFNKVPENADLAITMNYEYESSINQNSYQLRMLNLKIYKTGNKELVWRGTAFGTINTDAASGDLKHAVEGILSNFPPKE